MAGSSSTIAMRRDMAATIADGGRGQTRCPRFARIVRRFSRAAAFRCPRRAAQCSTMETTQVADEEAPRPALPLLALLALASALGVACAIVLAGLAMLL